MKRWATPWLLSLALSLGACAHPVDEAHLPYRSWSLGYAIPMHMDVWVEDVRIDDMLGHRFNNYSPGALGFSSSVEGDAAGWPKNPAGGAARNVTNAALPRRIFVRWQSLVEPQTYHVTLNVPDSVRQKMLTEGPPDPRPSPPGFRGEDRYYKDMVIGLAPGGWVKVWLTGPVQRAIPVMCVKAEIESRGPDLGLSKGLYAWSIEKLEPATQQYLKENPVLPIDSWKCSNDAQGSTATSRP